MNFEQLGLEEKLLRAVRASGYETPTPIQAQAIPHVLAGRDLMGCAQTGTGKTAAFALPTLQRLGAAKSAAGSAASASAASAGKRPGRRPIRALVLAPTRELAGQIMDSFAEYGRFTGARGAAVYGGVSQRPQERALREGVDYVVATPGRLLDLMGQGFVDLSRLEVLILDEADQMLDMGFLPDLKRIVSATPQSRQTLMFSATMPPEIRELAGQWLRSPQHAQVAPAGTPVERVAQSVYFIEGRDKPRLLTHYLRNQGCERTLVFARTKHGADKVVKQLERAGISAAAIHANKSQSVRTRALERFRAPRPPVLVATDIAARGLDVDGVTHVINYDLPEVPEVYVHRIGRTARAGAAGVAISFCAPDERGRLQRIERLTRRRLALVKTPTDLPPAPEPAQASRGEQAGSGRDTGSRRDTASGRETRSARHASAGQRLAVGSRQRLDDAEPAAHGGEARPKARPPVARAKRASRPPLGKPALGKPAWGKPRGRFVKSK